MFGDGSDGRSRTGGPGNGEETEGHPEREGEAHQEEIEGDSAEANADALRAIASEQETCEVRVHGKGCQAGPPDRRIADRLLDDNYTSPPATTTPPHH
jgi:hypothetical protein